MDRLTSIFVASLFSCISLSAQWLKYPAAGIPRLADGKPNLAAPAPKTRDGKPDFSGTWVFDESKKDQYHGQNLDKVVKGGLPYKPGVGEMMRARGAKENEVTDPLSSCLPKSPLLLDSSPLASGDSSGVYKLVQTPGLLIMLFEYNITWRQIHTDGRPFPPDPEPAWYGYSTGKWDGDTLVAETTGFKDGIWLDVNGNGISDAAKITERFRRPDFGHMQIDFTVDDPKYYSKPWTVTISEILIPDTDLIEAVCLENERDSKHYVCNDPAAPGCSPKTPAGAK